MNLKPLNILLADDDTDDCIFFAKALEEIPLLTNLTTVRNGEQLFKLLSQKNEQLPDVLFLDISMPGKTGIECLSEIKESENLNGIPVVMFTIAFPHNRDFETQIKNTLTGIGANDFIRKTSDFEELKQVIHTALISVAAKKAA